MKFFRDWLRVERPSGVALHPLQRLELERPYEAVFSECLRGIESVLGGIVRERDEHRGRIEATFGLVDSERLTCIVEPVDAGRTRVVIESRRGASAEPPKPSQNVRALAEFLQTNAR